MFKSTFKKKAEKELPIIPIKDVVLFPNVITPLFFEQQNSKEAIKNAYQEGGLVIIVAQKEKIKTKLLPDDIYDIGILANIPQIREIPAEGFLVSVVDAIMPVKIHKITQTEPYLRGFYNEIKETFNNTAQNEALFRSVLDQFKQVIHLGKAISIENLVSVYDLSNPIKTTNIIIFALDIKVKDKQLLLETPKIEERLNFLSDYLAKEISILKASQMIQNRTNEEIGKAQKEVYLREQLKSIEKELGIEEGGDLLALKQKIENAKMPDHAGKTAFAEYERLKKIPPYSPEVSWIRTYLDWLTDLPWSNKTKDRIDLKEAEKILNQDHYGLDKVKQMVLEYLAVIKLVGKIRGPILLFVGPPGTGKTSIGKSIAKAMNRKFTRLSLGGVRDEAEIKGFRRTYVGAQPGRIIQGIKAAGTKNPVFMLDEIDKAGVDFRGDPSAALLEALDPEQNDNFQDHYIEIPFDLSDVMFITTANIIDTIPPALKDRMEEIPFSGYTLQEKFEIAKKYLIPKLSLSHGIKKSNITLNKDVIQEIILTYTKEAGVRNLERELAAIFRKLAREIAESNKKPPFLITNKNIEKYLGLPKYNQNIKDLKDEIGITPALAWSEVGGVVLFVEAQPIPGKGNLILTGKLGNVMKESAQAAFTFARANAKKYGFDPYFYKNTDIHIHVPEGSIPKDGPSAGIAIGTAIISALAKRPVKKTVGLTGEITLTGKVLPIGGIKEKALAGQLLGITTIILPQANKRDLEDIPKEIRNKLSFVFVNSMSDVLNAALK